MQKLAEKSKEENYEKMMRILIDGAYSQENFLNSSSSNLEMKNFDYEEDIDFFDI